MRLEQIWLERSTINSEGKRVPTFWNPVPLVAIEGDQFDGQLMARLVSLGLTMELPVGELVTSQMQRIPGLNVDLIGKILKAAISDEARHDKGMRFAQQFLSDFGFQTDDKPASFLADIEALPYHPITKAALLEVTLFLPSLALMRLYGGQAFNRLALRINDDEQRHTRVNASLANSLGEPIASCSRWKPIRDSVLEYMVGDRSDLKDLIYKASNELWQTGDSPTLNSIPRVSALQFMAPFTVSNSEKYSRTVS